MKFKAKFLINHVSKTEMTIREKNLSPQDS